MSSSPPASPRQQNILLALTGSVAALKAPELYRELSLLGDVKVICTKPALHFFDLPALQKQIREHEASRGSAAASVPHQEEKSSDPIMVGEHFATQSIFTDEDEWTLWKRKGDPVLHIQLRQWADVFLIAPLDANTLAKLATGLCDNLVTCVARAWDFEKPFLVSPAMNDLMWSHPFTGKHLRVLEQEFGIHVVSPVRKLLACNVEGMGAMASPETIAESVSKTMFPGGLVSSVAEEAEPLEQQQQQRTGKEETKSVAAEVE